MVILFAMILSIVYEVILRYLFNRPTIWSTELCGYALVVLTFLAAAHTQHMGRHVRVDIVVKLLPWKLQRVLEVLVMLLALGYAGVVVWQGGQMAWHSYELNRHASTLLETPLFYPQVFLPIGALLLCTEFATNIYSHMRHNQAS